MFWISQYAEDRTESTEDEPFLDLDRILFNYLTSNEAINLLKLHGSLD
jgi:hypothetical protein